MQEQSVLEKLSNRVSQVVQQHQSLQGENEMLRSEIGALKETLAVKDSEVNALRDENTMKDLEIEEVVSKIESILG